MPVLYDRSLADEPALRWSHEAAHPDAIVINLSTNDFATGDPGAAFREAYLAFLRKLRGLHSNAFIVVATSSMLTDAYPEGESRRTKAIAALTSIVSTRQNEGDTNVELLILDEQLASDGYGCDVHPSKATHQKMALKLVDVLKRKLGW